MLMLIILFFRGSIISINKIILVQQNQYLVFFYFITNVEAIRFDDVLDCSILLQFYNSVICKVYNFLKLESYILQVFH